MYHPLRYNNTVSNPCSKSECSHLCLLVPGGHRCSCPDTWMASSHKKSEIVCDAASEGPRPLPLICPCENGGVCKKLDDAEEKGDALICSCPPNYLGDHCEIRTAASKSVGESSATNIIVSVLAVIFIIGIIVGAIYLYRNRPL